MHNIELEKNRIRKYETEIRKLETEKIRLEENEKLLATRLKEVEEAMTTLGVTPSNIEDVIQKSEEEINLLKDKIDKMLGIQKKEEMEFDF